VLESRLRNKSYEKVKEELKADIIIPTLNEENSIGELIRTIRSHSFPIQVSILVIDGGSKDKTVEICNKEKVSVLFQKAKGKGSAMREAVRASNADVVIFIDGDGTYSVDDLENLLEPLLKDQADMVVGSRIIGNREKGSISGFNLIGNKLFNKAINFAMNTKVTDSLSGYRAMYKTMFEDLILFSNNFEIEVELTVEALAKGYRVHEVPINYKLRKESDAKLNSIDDGLKIGQTLLFILLNVNPIKFFGIISACFIIAGLFPATLVLYEKITTGEVISLPSVVFASLLFMTGGISIVIGLVSELVVRSRRRIEYLFRKKF